MFVLLVGSLSRLVPHQQSVTDGAREVTCCWQLQQPLHLYYDVINHRPLVGTRHDEDGDELMDDKRWDAREER